MKMFLREQLLDGLVVIRSTLKAAGVESTEENGAGAGVRMWKAAG